MCLCLRFARGVLAAAAVAPVSCISLCCACFSTSFFDAGCSSSVFSGDLVSVFFFFMLRGFRILSICSLHNAAEMKPRSKSDPQIFPVWRYDTAAAAAFTPLPLLCCCSAAALLHDAAVDVDCCFIASVFMSCCCVSINMFYTTLSRNISIELVNFDIDRVLIFMSRFSCVDVTRVSINLFYTTLSTNMSNLFG